MPTGSQRERVICRAYMLSAYIFDTPMYFYLERKLCVRNTIMLKINELVYISLIHFRFFFPIKYCLNALLSNKILICDGKLFQRFPQNT